MTRSTWPRVLLLATLVLVLTGGRCDTKSKRRHHPVDHPAVVTTDPLNNETAVPPDQIISATFNEPMNPATLTTTTFTLVGNSLPVTGTVSYSGGMAHFMPTADLELNTVYTARITTGATDDQGRPLSADYVWTFTTMAAVDTFPPTVTEVYPQNLALNVPLNTSIEATFSEAMAPLSFTVISFYVLKGGISVTGAIAAAGNSAVFTPTGNLDPNTLYSVVITTSVTDLAGNHLQSDHAWSFTTGANSDLSAPTVVFTDPADAETGVELNFEIAATFSEAMNPLTLTTTSFTLAQGATNVPGTVSLDSNVAFFKPTGVLLANTIYTATITTVAADLAGNSLTSNEIWSFTTGTSTGSLSAVALGDADPYAVIAGSSVSVVATSSIEGHIGLSPGQQAFITGLALTDFGTFATSTQVTGLIYAADMDDPTPAMLTDVQADLTLAYDDAAGRLPAPVGAFFNPGSGDMAGLNLPPGLYRFTGLATASAAFTLTGSDTDVWIFQIPGNLQINNNVHLLLAGQAESRNIFWQVTGQVSLGQNVVFHGTIMTNGPIVVNQNTTLTGRVLSRNGAVTIDQSTVNVP